MSVVAFDDLPPEWALDPFLTVAVQPAYEIGRTAATILLDRVSGERRGPAEQVIFPVEIHVRRSSAPPPDRPAPDNA
jgi:LacI family transcriptional regulator